MFPFFCWGWYFRIILTPVYFSNQIFTICINNRWLSDFWCWSNSNILVFSGCTVPSDNKEIQLGGSSQEASPSAGKNTGVVLVPCGTWNCVPTAVWWCGYLQGHWMSFVTTEFSVTATIFFFFFFEDWCIMNLQPSFKFFIYFLTQ